MENDIRDIPTIKVSMEQGDSKIPETVQKRLFMLAKERMRILSLPPEKALKAILDHEMATPLVHSMPVEDFYFLTHEIGPDDCIELLGMASARQWEFFIDMDTWNRDRPETGALTEWLNRFFLADPARFVPWIWNEKPELVEYYLSREIEVRILDQDEDESSLPDGFFTYDGVFYVRVIPKDVSGNIITGNGMTSENSEDDEPGPDTRTEFITRLLKRLADEDLKRYQFTLLAAMAVIPAESEEEGFRLKNVRLAERGFLPFDEALEVYAPLGPKGMKKRRTSLGAARKGAEVLPPVPMSHAFMMKSGTPFSKALIELGEGIAADEILAEFASLCNRIIVADRARITNRQDLRRIVEKTTGYLNIGMHRLTGKSPTPAQAVSLVSSYPLSEIFRAGFQAAFDLKSRAGKWKKEGWFVKNGLPLTFWGERLTGYIGGLLLPRPKFYDNYESGRLYREFESMDDIMTAGAALDEAMAFDSLFAKMKLDAENIPRGRFISFENLLLTLWARNRAGLSDIFAPMDMARFRRFFESLWTDGSPRKIQDTVKTDFLYYLAQKSGQDETEVSKSFAEYLESMFAGIEDELGAVSADDLDYRFVNMFLIAPENEEKA